MKNFVDTGTLSVTVPGICQAKPANLDDTALELIPQQYLDNPSVDTATLTSEMKQLYSGMVFQRLTGEMQNESI